MRLPLSVEVSPWLNRCFRLFKCPLSFQIYCLVVNDPSLQLIIASEVDVFEHPRFCDEFSHLVNRSFDATASVLWSHTLIEYMFQTFYMSLEFPDLLLSSQWYFLSAYNSKNNSKWNRCFWASQILRWILTSSGWSHLCDWKSLLRSHFDWIDALYVLNVLLNFHIYCSVVNHPFLQLYEHIK